MDNQEAQPAIEHKWPSSETIKIIAMASIAMLMIILDGYKDLREWNSPMNWQESSAATTCAKISAALSSGEASSVFAGKAYSDHNGTEVFFDKSGTMLVNIDLYFMDASRTDEFTLIPGFILKGNGDLKVTKSGCGEFIPYTLKDSGFQVGDAEFHWIDPAL